MDLRKLEALVAAVELGSFTKAAQQLGYSQSGLTHMMNALEQEIGFSLLLRDHRGVRLTAQGRRLYPQIRFRFLKKRKMMMNRKERMKEWNNE